jgi:hypothetical protein
MATCGTAKWYPMGREQVVPYDRDLTGTGVWRISGNAAVA